MLQQKKILIGVTGSIAAYKIATLVRLLVKQGAEVQVIATKNALEFITPLTLSTLSKRPVYTEFVKNKLGEWTNHVDLGLWADLFLIAPASANTLSRMANGQSDDLLVATYLSARCPVMIAPAMDLDMYQHPSTLNNLKKLESYGNRVLEARNGELASGLVGQGRMAEPEELLEECIQFFSKKKLHHKKILITAGPTYEDIDPVRFIGNHSSGKMGFELALAAAQNGASVTLVSGPTHLQCTHPMIKLIRVRSAEEMYQECMQVFPNCDAAIMSAAVADYSPIAKASQKIKKSEDQMQIELQKTKDILKSLGDIKSKQVLVGFALETEKELEHAQLKLQKKNADFIVLNSLNDQGAGFGHDTNKVRLVFKDKKVTEFDLKSKKEVAADIIDVLSSFLTS